MLPNTFLETFERLIAVRLYVSGEPMGDSLMHVVLRSDECKNSPVVGMIGSRVTVSATGEFWLPRK